MPAADPLSSGRRTVPHGAYITFLFNRRASFCFMTAAFSGSCTASHAALLLSLQPQAVCRSCTILPPQNVLSCKKGIFATAASFIKQKSDSADNIRSIPFSGSAKSPFTIDTIEGGKKLHFSKNNFSVCIPAQITGATSCAFWYCCKNNYNF